MCKATNMYKEFFFEKKLEDIPSIEKYECYKWDLKGT